ncbi:hypothetical protein K1T71_014954 [Dendrolimus kikuchii]|nr:hypothetical protein K1T71_014954 [Dendrolimus kikuchii]
MKYLGLVLDAKWNFGAHFTQLAPRLLGAAAALARLLPNVGGPGTVSGREPSPECKECGAPLDTAVHTLVECAAWGPQRHALENVVGAVTSLQSFVTAMLRSEDCWGAAASFCEAVMLQKEVAERSREEDAEADPIRRRRTGRRRRRYAHLLLS